MSRLPAPESLDLWVAWHRAPGGDWQVVGSASTTRAAYLLLASPAYRRGQQMVLARGSHPNTLPLVQIPRGRRRRTP